MGGEIPETHLGAVLGLGLQVGHLGDLFEEVGLLHARLGAAALELGPRVGQDHLEVDGETCREGERARIKHTSPVDYVPGMKGARARMYVMAAVAVIITPVAVIMMMGGRRMSER